MGDLSAPLLSSFEDSVPIVPSDSDISETKVERRESKLESKDSITVNGGDRTPLPSEFFPNASSLVLPDLLQDKDIHSATLPSRLAALGRSSFRIMAAFGATDIGNTVVGYGPAWSSLWRKKKPGEPRLVYDLYILPQIYSRSVAYINVMLRVLLLFVICLGIISLWKSQSDSSSTNSSSVGTNWIIGSGISLYVLYKVSQMRTKPDGIMPFCRSMGVPEFEEFMFSYSWAVKAEDIRTLAKALYHAGVGVWIDVVKLCSGDEIRPVVRTIVAKAHRVVIFISDEYRKSANCQVEISEAIQTPEKCIVCFVNPFQDAALQKECEEWFQNLPRKGKREVGVRALVHGLPELFPVLSAEIQDMKDTSAYVWWRKQKISASVPDRVPVGVPIPPNSMWRGRIMPQTGAAVQVGPILCRGDCTWAGRVVTWPWMFVLAVIAVVWNFVDLIWKYYDEDSRPFIEYLWLAGVALCNMTPFVRWNCLFDTRGNIHGSLKPLIASRCVRDGVKIRFVGTKGDAMYEELQFFVRKIGHDYQEDGASDELPSYYRDTSVPISMMQKSSSFVLPGEKDDAKFSKHITVYVMNNFEDRDRIFSNDDILRDKNNIYIWSVLDPAVDPFNKYAGTGSTQKDEIGQKMMRYLILIAKWEKDKLAEDLFSAIGVRVVEIVHEG